MKRDPSTGNLPTAAATRYPVTPWSTQKLYRPFIKWSLIIGLTLGFATGAGMLLSRVLGVDGGLWWVTHGQSHGAAQVFGFAGLFTMGIATHVVPRFRSGSIIFPWPQRVVLWSIVIGVALHVIGQSFSDLPEVSSPLVAVSGVLVLVGTTVFAATLVHTLTTGVAPRQRVELWVAAAAFWAVAAAALHLAITVRMVVDSTTVGYIPWDRAMVAAGLQGFVLCFILGVSGRAVSGFLKLRPMHSRIETAAFLTLNVGVAWTVAGEVLGLDAEIAAWGPAVAAAGIALFVIALRALEPARLPSPALPGSYPRYNWFIRTAYFWLLVFAVFHFLQALEDASNNSILPAPLYGPVTHVLTLGFITGMIIGMGSRMVPLFEGAIIERHRALDAAWLCLTSSVALRLAFGYVRTGSDPALAISGTLALVALGLFAWAIRSSFTDAAREAYQRATKPGMARWQGAGSSAT